MRDILIKEKSIGDMFEGVNSLNNSKDSYHCVQGTAEACGSYFHAIAGV